MSKQWLYNYTRKTAVSPSPKLSFVTFEFCSACRRNAFFSFFKSRKMHFDLRPPMNLSTSILRGRRGVFWSYKKVVLHFRWQARDFLRFWHVLDGFFFWPVCGAASFLWGGWRWGHDNVLSFPSSLRFMLTRQWCYALGFRCLVLGLFLSFSCPWRDRGAAGVEIHRFKLYIFIQIVKLSPSDAFKVAKLHWMSWNTRKKSWRVVRWRFATFFHWKFPEIMTKPPALSSFSRRRDSGFARIYIYEYNIYIYEYTVII